MRSFRSPVGSILTEYWGDNHHPLYALLAHASRALFGEAPWSVRLPAVLFGVATIPALFALARRLVSTREALLACAFLSVSYHHVWFSQNARGYSAMAFFAVVLTWLALRGLSEPAWRPWAWYGVVAALAAFTHLTAIFIVVGHAVAVVAYLVLRDRSTARAETVRRAALGFALAAGLTVAFYGAMLPQVYDYFVNRPSNLLGVSTTRWAVLEGIRVLVLGLSGGMLAAGVVAVALGASCVGSGLVSLWRRAPAFVLLLIMPVLATIGGALMARGTMYPRFFFFAIGPVVIVVMRGAFAIAEWLAERIRLPLFANPLRVATVGSSALIVVSALSLIPNYRYPKQDFEGAMRFVLQAKGPADAVVSSGVPADPYTQLWQLPWPNIETPQQLAEARNNAPRTWVLYTFPRYLESRSPGIADVIRRECRPERVFRGTVGGGDIVVCTLERA
ncbi:MAG TPA: glycosyltransferase family 39 protein [Gemmatimonadaceae bacterium]|nr:glycosyltransferase family 39 protein [Gemmatimonadaceae bacterium]